MKDPFLCTTSTICHEAVEHVCQQEHEHVPPETMREDSEEMTNRQPRFNLLVVPYARDVLEPARVRGDEGRLGDR